ncbi:glycoside hydrolase family 35 protein [Amphibacillus cookii]|uniref:glycoside hydrolase family 35 protein n=1 Tax=Amphibacillus cookii TaxID=767787 RepID=UPI0019569C72|nr:beta-galactosidase family protein [Amphibacillus cookii]MBM7541571.1 beta-galactosidase [Amphibacillus cookii]
MIKAKLEVCNDFYVNSKPIKIVSGAIHYFRVDPSNWQDRLEKIKAMGCNTVETCVAWNIHEPKKGEYQFSGSADLIRFIELAQQLNLYIILRPSPYICAEWEFGGLPAWLLKDSNMKVRSCYRPFLEHVRSYYETLIPRIIPYQINNGGPIILIQVENEYGYYSNDKTYLSTLADMMEELGITVPLVTSDSTRASILQAGSIPDKALPTVNCGANLKQRLDALKAIISNRPLMCMEFWVGWFNVWGGEHQVRSLPDLNQDLKDMLEIGHINIYMAHGGTNFGFMNGANYYEQVVDGYITETYAPATTSYDYGAPISEAGELTENFHTFKQTIESVTGRKNQLPFDYDQVKRKNLGEWSVSEKVSLFQVIDDLSHPVYDKHPLTMEYLDQAYGYILYRSELSEQSGRQTIKLLDTNDRAQVFLNEKHLFTAYRETFKMKQTLSLSDTSTDQLDILVENMGRANFGPYLNEQRKGINKGVMLDEHFHTGWGHYPLPLTNLDVLDFNKGYRKGQPAFYKIIFNVDQVSDTYLTLPGWGKGCVFLNQFNLGRFWKEGPQHSLYVPASKLITGENQLIIFETEGEVAETIQFISDPIIDEKL